MDSSRPNLLFRIARGLWRGLDRFRRLTFNLLFLLVVVALLAAALGGGGPEVPERAALVLAPRGQVVEQLSGDSLARLLGKLDGSTEEETLLSDLLDAIDEARADDRIAALYLQTDELTGIGPSKLQDLEQAIGEFKAAGKKVVAAGDLFTTGSYHLAAQADEVHLNPMGMVLLDGYGLWRPYFRAGLDKYEVDVHVFRVGEYKSAVEPYLRDGISPEARESYLDVLGDLWGSYLGDVAAARKTTPEAIAQTIEGIGDRLRAAGGDGARLALEAGLVDKLSNRDEVRARMVELVGEEEDGKGFSRIGVDDYLKASGRRGKKPAKGDAVGVVVAKGTILDGTRPPGEIGGDSTAALVRQAREDEKIKAVVLRVDSGGGSAFASEVIRRELELTRGAGKPVVVSMGSVAASGGYWIATSSDEIWASPDTITGSIGIFGMIPTFQKPLAKYLGVTIDGVGTTWLSGAIRPDRALDPRAGELVQLMIDRGYEEFLERVAKARNMSRDEVDRIARGRIWSGADAKSIGLVDQLGGLEEAIAAAAGRAGLEGEPKVRYLEPERTWKEKLAEQLFSAAIAVAGEAPRAPRGLSPARSWKEIERRLEPLLALDDPTGLVAHCLCEVE
ncbi:MAG: signal peptide peptidase SppA [Thermoanaerobaculia bacterium]|nr:signal peptide peptidase SppA [Thermoanaerobaculia bacterium]